MNKINGTVSMPFEYFAKTKDDYADWVWALFREIIQNSYDAKAKKLKFTIKCDTDGTVNLVAEDDGCGMDKNTLLNVLLCMGASKKDAGAVGGFGIAKSLILFAHPAYLLRTGCHKISGKGGDWTYEEVEVDTKGVILKIEVVGASVSRLISVLRQYVRLMYTENFDVYVNESYVIQDGEEKETQYAEIIETDMGEIWYDDLAPDVVNSQLTVVYRGLPMYNYIMYANGHPFKGSLYITGSDKNQTAQLFTSNRDSLKDEYRTQFNTLCQRLTTDRKALALANNLIDITMNASFEAARDFVANENDGTILKKDLQEAYEKRMKIIQTLKDRVDFSKYQENFALKLEDVVMRRSSKRHTLSLHEVANCLNKKSTRVFAETWDFYVRQLLTMPSMQALIKDYAPKVHTGLLITNDKTEGLCSWKSNVVQLFANPLTIDSDWYDDDILDLAVHEVSHIKYPDHGADFSYFCDILRKEYRRMLNDKKVAERATKKLAVM